jgi:hypothetical protein
MCFNVPFIILGREVYDFVPFVFLILYPVFWFCSLGNIGLFILCFFKYISIGKGFEVISPEKMKTLVIILEILKKPDSEII